MATSSLVPVLFLGRIVLDEVGEFDVRYGLGASLGRRRVGEEWDFCLGAISGHRQRRRLRVESDASPTMRREGP